jgi:hypothetical protein
MPINSVQTQLYFIDKTVFGLNVLEFLVIFITNTTEISPLKVVYSDCCNHAEII